MATRAKIAPLAATSSAAPAAHLHASATLDAAADLLRPRILREGWAKRKRGKGTRLSWLVCHPHFALDSAFSLR